MFTFLRRKRDVARLVSFAAGQKGKGRSAMAPTPSHETAMSSRSGGLRFFRRRPGIGKSKISDVEMLSVHRKVADDGHSGRHSPKDTKMPDQWSIQSQLVDKRQNMLKDDDADVAIKDV